VSVGVYIYLCVFFYDARPSGPISGGGLLVGAPFGPRGSVAWVPIFAKFASFEPIPRPVC
jgi:hypothetical protein